MTPRASNASLTAVCIKSLTKRFSLDRKDRGLVDREFGNNSCSEVLLPGVIDDSLRGDGPILLIAADLSQPFAEIAPRIGLIEGKSEEQAID